MKAKPESFNPNTLNAMSFGDLSRINTNVAAIGSLSQLQRTNSELGIRQFRLATGSRLNRAEDDSAGFTIVKKLEAKLRGQTQALANIGDAKSMLTVAEGGLGSVMDILHTMKGKAVQAANDTMGTDERTAIGNELTALASEIDDIINNSEYNSNQLLDGTGGTGGAFQFHVGAEAAETFTTNAIDASALVGLTFDVSDATNATAEITNIDGYVDTVSSLLSNIGDDQKRLSFKQENLQTAITNYESAKSRIADADFAMEQMEITKLQILQQTGLASMAQANAGPQSVLSLLGG